MLHGVDISNHQGYCDWGTAKASGRVDFALVKASEGVSFTDAFLARNVAELRRLDIPLGTYHYALPSENSPEAEARHYAGVLGPLGILPGESQWQDMEDPDLPVGGEAGQWSLDNALELNRLLGDDPGIYTYPSYIPERSMDEPGLARFRLWYASYDGDPTAFYAGPVPRPWRAVTIWQYTAFEAIPGLGDNIDCNWFDGTVEQFKALGRRVAIPPEVIAANLNQPDPLTGKYLDPLFAGIYDRERHGEVLQGSCMYSDGVIRQLCKNVILEKPGRKEAQVGTGLGQIVAAQMGPTGYPEWPSVKPLV